MAVTNEVLRLEDQFSAGLRTFIDLMGQSNTATQETRAALETASQQAGAYTTAVNAQASQIRMETAELNRQTAEIRRNEAAERAAARARNESESGMRKLMGAVKGLAGAYIGIQGMQKLLNVSDTLSQIDGRLNLMAESFNEVNGQMVTTEELTNKIYAAANNTRSSFSDTAAMVSKLGTLAGSAFADTDEVVAFAEQINKQMKLSGTSTAEAQGAMLQLTQAMSSGTLRGEELNSILEQTPMIAQTIAEYLGMSVGEMREFASTGGITAEIVKNAMFSAADETNEKFEQIPATWSEVFALAGNTIMQSLQPAFEVISQGAQWASENIDMIIPVLYGAAAAMGAYAIATGIATLATVAAKIANEGLKASLLSNPIGWIVLLIGAAVTAVYMWIQSVGGLKVAYLTVTNTIMTKLEELQLWANQTWSGITNGARDTAANIAIAVQDMINGVIDGLNGLITMANKIFDLSIGTLDRVSFGTEFALSNEIAKEEKEAEIKAMEEEFKKNQMERKIALAYAKREAEQKKAEQGPGVPEVPEIPEITQTAANTGATAEGVDNLNKAVNMADEDVKSLVDIATRRYVNNVNLTTQAPVINVSGQNVGSTAEDRRRLADTLRDIIIEQAVSGATTTVAPV